MDRTHHRNGISGLSFDVWLTAAALGIQFTTGKDTLVPLAVLEKLTEKPLTGPVGTQHHRVGPLQMRTAEWFKPDTIICSFDELEDETKTTFVGVYQPLLPEAPFAVFQWDLLLVRNVEFGVNSWRGDEFLSAVEEVFGPLKAIPLPSQSDRS